MEFKGHSLIQNNDYSWKLEKAGGMRVPGVVYASEKMIKEILRDNSLQQVINVAHLPGIEKWSIAMPDIHQGYGFPIGGVAAMDLEKGVISPGGVGYDINCGCRLLSRTKARKSAKGRNIRKELSRKGISIYSSGKATLLEEVPWAYKDVSEVVDVVHDLGIAAKVARLRPLIVVKG